MPGFLGICVRVRNEDDVVKIQRVVGKPVFVYFSRWYRHGRETELQATRSDCTTRERAGMLLEAKYASWLNAQGFPKPAVRTPQSGPSCLQPGVTRRRQPRPPPFSHVPALLSTTTAAALN